MDETTRILIAEDNADHAELSKSILQKKFNCTVEVTSDGKSCLNAIRSNHYDILLLDYILPDRNGLAILNEVNELNSSTAVIMITGQGDEKVAVEAMKSGAYDYIVKSTGYLTTLPLVIKKAIEKHLLTIAQQQMKDQLVEHNKSLNILYQISSTLNVAKPFPELINDSLSQILKMMKLDYGAIYLTERLSGELSDVFCQGFEKRIQDHIKERLLSDSFRDLFYKINKNPLSLEEVVQCDFSQEHNQHLKALHINIYGLKLKQKNIGFFITGGRPLTETDKNIFNSLLNQIVVVIERNVLLIEEKKAREFSENLRTISEIINSSLDINEILNSILKKIVAYVDATCGAIFIFKPHSNSFESVYDYQLPDCVYSRLKNFDKSQVLESFKNNRKIKHRSAQTRDNASSIKSFLSIPITNRDEIIGIIDLGSNENNSFTDDDRVLLKAISDQVSTAIDKARLFEQVNQLKEFNENIVQNLEEGILIENETGEITFSNPKMESLVNLPREAIHLKKLTDFLKTDYHQIVHHHKNLLKKKQPCRFEAALCGDSTNDVIVQISCHPLFEGQRFLGSLTVIVDISEIKHLESQILQSEKLSAVGQLVSGVAHELNNPLSSIIGLAKLLAQDVGVKKFRDDLEIIYKEGYRCHKIVDNLLTFARKHTPEKIWTDIHDVIISVLELRSFQFRKDEIHIQKKFSSKIPKLYIDFHQFQQVFLNLITNAHQALLAKSDNRKITLSTKIQDEKVHISISDNGSGIPTSIFSKIFDPFFTTKDQGQGTGLGLSICYGIIDNHEGVITVENLPNSGACFNIELPVSKNLPEKQTRPSCKKSIKVNEKHILVIDDEQTIIELLQRFLTREGHRVDVAKNGAIALKKMKENDYEIIISDLRMPGITGKTIFDVLGKIAPKLQQRMIFTTGDSDSDDAFEFLNTNNCRYINKPFTFEELQKAISEVCLIEKKASNW